MPQALLVAGNSKRYFDEASFFKKFLEEKVGIGDVRIIPAAYTETEQVEKELETLLRTNEPVVVLYDGHGGKTGWCLDDTRYLKYETLTELLKQRIQPLLILNSCCHSFSLASYLEKANISEQIVSLIASCSTDNTSYQGVVEDVIEAWNEHKPYQPPLEEPVSEKPQQPTPNRAQALSNRAKRYWAHFPGRMKSWIVDGRSPHKYCDENILNFWQHLRSRILHRITFGKILVTIPRIQICMNEEMFIIKEVIISTRSLGARRWGKIIDHHFFPPKGDVG